jgi:hypothetical protein
LFSTYHFYKRTTGDFMSQMSLDPPARIFAPHHLNKVDKITQHAPQHYGRLTREHCLELHETFSYLPPSLAKSAQARILKAADAFQEAKDYESISNSSSDWASRLWAESITQAYAVSGQVFKDVLNDGHHTINGVDLVRYAFAHGDEQFFFPARSLLTRGLNTYALDRRIYWGVSENNRKNFSVDLTQMRAGEVADLSLGADANYLREATLMHFDGGQEHLLINSPLTRSFLLHVLYKQEPDNKGAFTVHPLGVQSPGILYFFNGTAYRMDRPVTIPIHDENLTLIITKMNKESSKSEHTITVEFHTQEDGDR